MSKKMTRTEVRIARSIARMVGYGKCECQACVKARAARGQA